jgi:hypothetical protein
MTLKPDAWLDWLARQPENLERGAVPTDPQRRRLAALKMASLQLPHQDLYPWGLEAGRRLWEPWARAREAVEALDLAAESAQVDWIIHDQDTSTVTLATLAPLPSACPRFGRRECPRMVPMGHESALGDCNYWAWEGFAAALPGLELYPEWQRFDCHKFHALMQVHLCGLDLARRLKARLQIEVWSQDREATGKLVEAYAQMAADASLFCVRGLSASA